MKNAILEELAGTWEVSADTGNFDFATARARRKTLRECADTLRMLLAAQPAPNPKRQELAFDFAKSILQGMLATHSLRGPNVKDQREAILREAFAWADAFLKAADEI
jgi:hypothetical protein